jgi:hypothetical protein
MDVDSTHSEIESCLTNRPLNCLSNYVDVIKIMGNNHSYTLNYTDNTFFGDYTTLKSFELIRPGFKSGNPAW